MQHLYTFTLLLILYLVNPQSIATAAPLIKLCLAEKCKKPLNIELSHAAWSSVKDLYSSPFSNDKFFSDKDEQDNIASSINLMESDIYYTLARRYIKDESSDRKKLIREKAQGLFASNSSKNNYRNIKTYMGVLLDNYLVTRHFIRKAMQQKNWVSLTEGGLLLQSLSDSKIYILQTNNSALGKSPVITPYQSGNGLFNYTDSQQHSNDDDDDFE